MIQNSPLLKPSPYGSLTQGAQYNPFTLFIRNTMRGEYFVAQGTHYDNSEEFDAFIQQMIEDEASSFHEEFHWLQYNGTTVGAFLALLRYSQERTTINEFMHSKDPDVLKLLQQRFQENAIPIVPLNEEGELDVALLDEADKLNTFRQIWYDHQLVYTLFNSSLSQDNISYPREQVFGEIASDLILHFCDTCGLRYPGNHLARKWFRFDDGEVVFVNVGGKRLTTLGIIEGITTANELQLLYLRGASHEFIKDFICFLNSSSYGVALITFLMGLDFNPKSVEDLLDIIPTFNTVCDIALNPPLPPFFMCAPDSSDHWFWRDIYPPLRLVQLVEAVNNVGFLPMGSEHDSLYAYIDTLCAALGWSSPNNYVHPFKKFGRVMDFDTIEPGPEEIKWDDDIEVLMVPSYFPPLNSDFIGTKWVDNKDAEKELAIKKLIEFDYYHYLLWVQDKAWDKRKENLPIFINPIECRYKKELFHYYEDISYRSIFGSIWTKPPFVWASDGNWGFSTASHNFNSWLLINSCLHYFLFDIVAGTGKFDTSAYPPSIRGDKLFDTVRKSLEFSLGIKIPKEILGKEYPKVALFELGECLGTPKVIQAFKQTNMKPEEYLVRGRTPLTGGKESQKLET